MKVTRMVRTHLMKKEAKKRFNLTRHGLPTEGSHAVLRENWTTGEREYLLHAGREGQFIHVHEWPEVIDGTDESSKERGSEESE